MSATLLDRAGHLRPPNAAASATSIRAYRPSDRDAVNRVFDSQFALGTSVHAALWGASRYRALCLDWYLGPGARHAAVIEHEGEVAGYVLACVSGRDHARWAARRSVALGLRVVMALLVGGLDRTSRRFYLARLREVRTLGRRRAPMPAHIHLNLERHLWASSAALLALEHADRCCAEVGLRGWYGEINTMGARRSRPLARLGLEVVESTPNTTLTRLLGVDVNRLTVVRRLPEP